MAPNTNTNNNNTKVALVTGGGRGIGLAISQALINDGFDLILTYQNNSDAANKVTAEAQTKGRKASALKLDVGDIESLDAFVTQVKSVLSEWGSDKIHTIVHNAGFVAGGPVADITDDQWASMFNVHARGPFFLTQKLLTDISDGGRIIFTTTKATNMAIPGMALYIAAKSAAESFVRGLAVELGPRGITVNAVAPGPVATDLLKPLTDSQPGLEDGFIKNTPLGRVGQAGDVGGIVSFLASDSSRWVTGERIQAAGGMHL